VTLNTPPFRNNLSRVR